MTYHLAMPIIKSIEKDAAKRGYDKEQATEYIKERKELYEKQAKLGDAVVLSTLAGTAGTIAYKTATSRFKNLSRVATIQFKPFLKELKTVTAKMEANLHKQGLKSYGLAIINGFELSLRSMKGFCQSIPKPLAVPALITLALSSIIAYGEKSKIDAKHDTIKYLKEKSVNA